MFVVGYTYWYVRVPFFHTDYVNGAVNKVFATLKCCLFWRLAPIVNNCYLALNLLGDHSFMLVYLKVNPYLYRRICVFTLHIGVRFNRAQIWFGLLLRRGKRHRSLRHFRMYQLIRLLVSICWLKLLFYLSHRNLRLYHFHRIRPWQRLYLNSRFLTFFANLS